MNLKPTIAAAIALISVNCVQADAIATSSLIDTYKSLPQLPWLATLSAGPTWAKAGTNQTFYLAPEIEKAFTANRPSKILANGELFIGIEKKLPQQLKTQLGIFAATTSQASLSGNIWDDADPEFNNYVYNYKIQHTAVGAKGKLFWDKSTLVTPWVSVGLGAGFNRSNSYNNTPFIFEVVTMPNFASHTRTTFTYTLGAGLEKALDEHVRIGLGYEFADWGASQLSRASTQTLNDGLSVSHIRTNGLMFNFTYLS